MNTGIHWYKATYFIVSIRNIWCVYRFLLFSFSLSFALALFLSSFCRTFWTSSSHLRDKLSDEIASETLEKNYFLQIYLSIGNTKWICHFFSSKTYNYISAHRNLILWTYSRKVRIMSVYIIIFQSNNDKVHVRSNFQNAHISYIIAQFRKKKLSQKASSNMRAVCC